MPALLQVTDLHYSYPRASDWALRGVNLRIGPGEMVALAGPSACGKSTLALAMAGFLHERPGGQWRGTVHAEGTDLASRSLYENAELVGLVQQNPEDQFCTLTVEDEIAFGLENRCYPPEQIASQIDWTLDIVAARHLQRRQLSTLSGGEQQRVAIASVLAARPRILILDEPTSNLDPTATQSVLQVLERLRRQEELTLVIVEHKLEVLAPFAPRIVLMEDGRIVQGGAPPPASERPAPRNPSAPGETVAKLVRVSHDYGSRPALDDISLELQRGHIVALMGDNGSGKSTLLRCLMGLIRPTSGAVTVLGNTVPTVSSLARRAGIVFQNPDHQLLGETVWDDAIMLARNTGQEEPVRPRAQELLRQGGLWERREDSPWRLSYGQKRRLNVTAALAHGPDLLLADEILIGQDLANAHRLMRRLRESADSGAAVLLALHSVALAQRYADRALFLDSGRLAFDGTLEALGAYLAEHDHTAYLEPTV